MEKEMDLENFWERYEGTFKESKKDGIGCLHLKNGEIFLGEFFNDKANGLGVYYKEQEDKIVGMWKDNDLIQKF